jgi:CRP-like cAMP-binding protein
LGDNSIVASCILFVMAENLPEEVVYEICQMLLPYPAEAGDFIYHKGSAAREVFVMNRGEVVLTTALDGREIDYGEDSQEQLEQDIIANDRHATLFAAGHVFGEEALDFEDLVKVRRTANAIAVKSTHMSMLRVNMVEALAKKFPVLEKEVKNFQANRLKRDRRSGVIEATATLPPPTADDPAPVNVKPSGRRSSITRSLSDRIRNPTQSEAAISSGGPAHVRDVELLATALEEHTTALFDRLEAKMEGMGRRLEQIETLQRGAVS